MATKVRIPIAIDRIDDFCRRHRVLKMSLFGSVVRDDFRPDSDVDVLVEFYPKAPISLFDMVRMRDELEQILDRRVDLVEKAALRNPFRRHAILTEAELLYEA